MAFATMRQILGAATTCLAATWHLTNMLWPSRQVLGAATMCLAATWHLTNMGNISPDVQSKWHSDWYLQ